MFKSKLLQHLHYPLNVQTVVHKPLKALSTLAYLQTSWWQQLLSMWQLQSRRAGNWSNTSPIPYTQPDSAWGGMGVWGTPKYKEELPLPGNSDRVISLGLAGVMRTRIGSWRATNVLWHYSSWRHVRWQVPSEHHRHQPSSHRSQPTLSLAHMTQADSEVLHIPVPLSFLISPVHLHCPIFFSHLVLNHGLLFFI